MKKRVNYDFERRKKEQDRQRKKEAKLLRKQQGNATDDEAPIDAEAPHDEDRGAGSPGA